MKTKNRLYKFLLYVTNNEEHPRDEEKWDIAGFIISTTVLSIGIYLICIYKEILWAPFLIIEYLWYIDNMRHNRQ